MSPGPPLDWIILQSEVIVTRPVARTARPVESHHPAGLDAAALDRPVPRPGQGQGRQGDPAGAVSRATLAANMKAPPEGAALMFVRAVSPRTTG